MLTDSLNDYLLQHTSKKELVRKELDDVLGGAAAWENVDSVESKNIVQRGPKAKPVYVFANFVFCLYS